MKIANFFAHKSTNQDGNSFVGIKLKNNEVHFYYPEAYRFDENNPQKESILSLLNTISLAKTVSQQEDEGMYDSRKEESSFALKSYVWIIEDYIRNGYYQDLEKVLAINQSGKVNWKKTMKQQPMISGMNIIYKDLIVERKSIRDNTLTMAYKYCLKKAAKLIGWLFDISPDYFEIEDIHDSYHSEFVVSIEQELNKTFDDQKRERLINMENVLLGVDETVEEDTVVYGVDSYNYVFERMVDRVFGNVPQKEIKNYYPSITWNLLFGENPKETRIRPDTILRDEEDVYILDSKFYRYASKDMSKIEALPDAGSIVKQVAYAQFIKENKDIATAYNAFILPYNSEANNLNISDNTIYAGSAIASWGGNEERKIHLFLVDLTTLINIWSEIYHDDYKQIIKDKIKEHAD